MAAGDFSPSALQKVQVELSRLWGDGALANIYNTPIDTAKTLLEQNTMIELPVIENGVCVATKVYYLTDTNSKTVGYSGAVSDPALGCDLPAGKQGESGTKEYTPDLFIHETVQFSDDLCANEIGFAALSAERLSLAMANIRWELNQKGIAHLNASAQAPASGSTDYTVTGTSIEVPTADFTPDLIAQFYQIGLINQMSNVRIHNGTNFFTQFFNAQFNALNDNQRDQLAKLGALNPMTWDIRDLDGQLTQKASFVYDPAMLGFFNYRGGGKLQYDPVLLDPSKNVYGMLIDDPVLMYTRNVRNPQTGQVSTETLPVTYLVEHQFDCDGRDTLSQRKNVHKYNIRFVGGYTNAPQGAAGETRVLKFVNTPPV